MTQAIVGLFERNHSDKLDEIVELVNHINESTNELLRKIAETFGDSIVEFEIAARMAERRFPDVIELHVNSETGELVDLKLNNDGSARYHEARQYVEDFVKPVADRMML